MGTRLFLLLLGCFWAGSANAEEPGVLMTLQAAMNRAYSSNPEIGAAQANWEAEQAKIRVQSFLDDPHIGYMHEANMNFMEQTQGPMDTLFISQQIKFPTKYFLLGKAQSARALAAQEMAKQKSLEVRSKVVAEYYNFFTINRILSLLRAQRESLREIARTAESRYATGAVPQQDEMKAHVEQTLLEKDILMVEQEQTTAQAMLSAALGFYKGEIISLPNEELLVPKITVGLLELPKMVDHHSRHIKEALARVEESEAQKNLAGFNYAPDFDLSYRKTIGSYASQNPYSLSIGVSIPLWFFAKQSGEVSSASARVNEAEKKLEAIKVKHVAEVRSLLAKVNSTRQILEIYQTGLIPQATSTLNSSRAAYRAGRSQLLELLDSERSLYNVQIVYYRALAQYAENVGKLEEILGESISSIPFGDVS
jgi:cobalt-zinc-cadmium efflux system outer membrane protein